MKVEVGFQELKTALDFVNSVLSDKSVDDKTKNVIFFCTSEGMTVLAKNAFIFSRTPVSGAVSEGIDPEDEWRFQLKANELNKIISAYSTLYKTKVENITFEESGVRVKVIVHEVAKEEGDERLNRDSSFELENAPITDIVCKELHQDFPEEVSGLSSSDIMLYISSLLPLMSNDSATTMASKLNFAEDYVFIISSHRSAFFQNRLPVEFKGMCLNYSSVSFIKKMCESSEMLSISRLDKYLCVEAVESGTQAFMRHNPVKINYKSYVSVLSKNNGIVIDRLYFRDVLRRMGILASDGVIEVLEDNEILVQNEKFEQTVPLEKKKGETSGIKFKVSIPLMEELILGDDSVFSDPLYVYFVPTASSYMLYVLDKRGIWFTNAKVMSAN